VGIGLGAFAGHALKARLTPELLAIFETGVRYQLYHAFALFAAAWGFARWRRRAFVVGGGSFVAGIVLFSGSLYVLALSGIRAFGMVTPLGGVAFLAGWGCLIWGAARARDGERAVSQVSDN
jgi:uncharacterized membrane protein YgdD (TMEM256/DUF423 family)